MSGFDFRKLLVAAGVALAVCAPSGPVWANKVRILHAFRGAPDGANPNAAVTADGAGNLYGTTSSGGVGNFGTVFKLAPDGTETLLHTFAGGADGASPYAPLTLDKAGNLYSTTYGGGAGDLGTVFKVAPDGTKTVLHGFAGGSDGANPFAGLTLDRMGNLYGATYAGGGACDCGVIFKLTPAGQESVVHAFRGPDGANPFAAPILDGAGNLLGTTGFGGAHDLGTVFRITPQGQESVLHSFNGADGFFVDAGLLLDRRGNLYGTVAKGVNRGCGDGCGAVFKLTPRGKLITLYAFTGKRRDGGQPFANLIADPQGNLYSTAIADGRYKHGGVFKLAVDGSETLLYSFTGGLDGAQPISGLIMDAQGALYGTTSLSLNGGLTEGAVFKLAN